MKPNNPLRMWRKSKQLRALDIALKMGVSEQTILAYEKGGFQPSEQNLKKLSVIVDTPLETLKEAWQGWRNQHVEAD